MGRLCDRDEDLRPCVPPNGQIIASRPAAHATDRDAFRKDECPQGLEERQPSGGRALLSAAA